MTRRGRLALAGAAAAGLAAGAATDGLLAAAGAARIVGLQVGVAALPLLVPAMRAHVRRPLTGDTGVAMVVLGAAWTLAPLIDQHVTRAVVVAGALPDLVHHLAGWPALVAGARLVHRPRTPIAS